MADAKTEDRELDTTTASMDIHSLNNIVVSLRGLMKKVQLFTIQKLVRQSKQLRLRKKGPEEICEKKQKKAERLISEVGTIKELKIDHTIKYALANTRTFEEVAAKGDLETRAKVRLSTHPLMVAKVTKWREEHTDWQALAAFIMYKNTGRRFKKKKKKDRTKASEDAPEKSELEREVEENEDIDCAQEETDAKYMVVSKIGDGLSAKELAKKAKRAQKEIFIQKKAIHCGTVNGEEIEESTTVVEGDTSEEESGSDKDGNEISAESKEGATDEGSSKEDVLMRNSVKKLTEVDQKNSAETESDVESGSQEGSINAQNVAAKTVITQALKNKPKLQTQSTTDKSPDSDEETDASETDPTPMKYTVKNSSNIAPTQLPNSKRGIKKEDSRSDHNRIATKANKPTNVKESIKIVSKEVKPKLVGYKATAEMAIKKIYLTALSDDVEDIPIDKDARSDLSFLFSSTAEVDPTKSKGKRKDNFFSIDGDNENDDNYSDDISEETSKTRHYGSDGDDYMHRQVCHKKIESAFVGRLSDKQAKGDWGDGKGSFKGRREGGRGGYRSGFSSDPGKGRGTFSSDRSRGRGGFSGGKSQSAHGQGSWNTRDGAQHDDGKHKRKMLDEGKLHPSWEAKRLKKEKESKITTFQGTKITFDD